MSAVAKKANPKMLPHAIFCGPPPLAFHTAFDAGLASRLSAGKRTFIGPLLRHLRDLALRGTEAQRAKAAAHLQTSW